eukprot:5361934-Ditylum_brightwellii.AAC.1
MLDSMELKFNQIRDLSGETVFTTKQFMIQVFRALLTTTNQDFKCSIKGKKDPFDEGNSIDIYSIIKSGCTTSTTRINLMQLTQKMQLL